MILLFIIFKKILHLQVVMNRIHYFPRSQMSFPTQKKDEMMANYKTLSKLV